VSIQHLLETPEKPHYILISRIMLKNFIMQTPELVVVHNEKYTKWAIV